MALGRDSSFVGSNKLLQYVFIKKGERGLSLFDVYATVPCRFQRPRGAIPSSMLGLEIVTGSLDHFGFEDCLNGELICLSFSNCW